MPGVYAGMNMGEEESSFSTSFDALLTKELSVELVTSKMRRQM
jgi:hypothetical protein